ncbi:TRAP transporter small permease subunit [Devosia sp.]|uniref:TRAP transporter small permease subunit n=1 Tax=Devosia sp. TaxID=1871048 RepID=UPI0032679536
MSERDSPAGGIMALALSLPRGIDRISRVFGIVATWLVLFSSMISAINALFRYSTGAMLWLERSYGWQVFGWLLGVYGRNSNALSEAVWYMFAGMVMLGGAWAFKINEHVRVDLVYGAISEKARTWIDLLGGLFFLLPLCVLMVYFTWPWFWQSFMNGEGSLNAGGLVRWPARLMIPLGFALLGLQGIAEIIKCIAALTTDYVREFAYEKPLQ